MSCRRAVPNAKGPRAVGWGLARLAAIRWTKGKVTGSTQAGVSRLPSRKRREGLPPWVLQRRGPLRAVIENRYPRQSAVRRLARLRDAGEGDLLAT